MAKLNAIARKNFHGVWECSSMIDLGAEYGPQKINSVNIVTMKRSSGYVVTTATAGRSEGNSFSYVMFQDFNEALERTSPGRATAKFVENQHNAYDGDEIAQKVRDFYTK